MAAERKAAVTRNTQETRITASVNLDGNGASKFDTGLPFLEHMLDQIARHGLVDMDISAKGDLHIDAHHTVEDIGITLGQAFAKAAGDKKGIRRYGHAYVPLDEALSRVVIDLSGRPGLEYHVDFPRARIGDFDADIPRDINAFRIISLLQLTGNIFRPIRERTRVYQGYSAHEQGRACRCQI